MVNLNIITPQERLHIFFLIYRWTSLVLALWLLLSNTDIILPGVSLTLLLILSIGISLLITIFRNPFRLMLLRSPIFLGVDIIFMAILLAFSGVHYSPYILYAFSPLLVGAFLFQIRGSLLAAATFTLVYPSILLIIRQENSLSIAIGQLSYQLIGIWVVTLLFGTLSDALKQLRQDHNALMVTYNDLVRKNAALAAKHHQLEITHELTLSLHASDRYSVLNRLLKAVTKEFDFSQAVVSLVNPNLQRLENWQADPPLINPKLAHTSLPITPKNGPITRAVLEQQVTWCAEEEFLSSDKLFTDQLGQGNWLILPMVWQGQAIGVLLVSVEVVGPVDLSDERWAIMTSLVSQAAAALGIIDRTRRLAVEQERNRIARDIHDTVAQSLFGTVFTLDACIKLLPKQVKVVHEELVELRNVVDNVRQQVRQSILDIWPTNLTQEQFKLDLDKYVKQCAPGHKLNIEFTFNGDFNSLPALIRRNLYRVCQEALANTARHADVDSARVYIYVEQEEVHLSIRDKGQGFDPKYTLARLQSREKFGLRGIQERIQELGGTCDIMSQVGHGTQILVWIPTTNGRNGHG